MADEQRKHFTQRPSSAGQGEDRQQRRANGFHHRAQRRFGIAIDRRFDQKVGTAAVRFGRDGMDAGKMDHAGCPQRRGDIVSRRVAQFCYRALDIANVAPLGPIAERNGNGQELLGSAHDRLLRAGGG